MASTTDAIEVPPQYQPSGMEAPLYQEWVEHGYFRPRAQPASEPYVIVIPPPNVTSVLHMGHGLNNTIQDVLIRFERMRGRAALYLPGTDHAGIATQNVVERILIEAGRTRFDLGREAFVDRVWQHVREVGQIILDQLRAIGTSCDWERTRFTLDDGYSAAVRHVFVTLWEQRLIYRGHRVIHWCPRCLTALSDEEAEFSDADGKLYYLRYPVVGEADRAVVVATTRPETMLGDTAVAAHPDAVKTAWAMGKRVRLPMANLELEVIADRAVDPEFGTGFVKVTPAHDANDFEIGARHNLPMPLVLDPSARMTQPEEGEPSRVPQELIGLDRLEARERIVARLREEGLLEKVEPHHHGVRHCHRCDSVVEPRLSDQWFVKMKPLAEPALEAYRAGKLRFVPERWGTVYENWLTNIRDWNISRQLWWGHRIPVFRCDACGEEWASRTDPSACGRCGSSAITQDPDVLDTWFSSWLWPFATLGWPETTPDLERFYPGHTLVTGPDILFFWVARMVMAGCHFLSERPFETVYLNGMVRDTQHRKMSKSAGNGIDPMEVVDRFGADALRFTAIAGAPVGTDLILDPDDLETAFAPGRNFCNKLWNIGRFVLANLGTGDEAGSAAADRPNLLADRWILSRLQATIGEVTDNMERFRLNDAANLTHHFVWSELADWYVELVKPRLQGAVPGGAESRAVLRHAFETALRLLHPIVPFITEALWRRLPRRGPDESLVTGPWPAADPALHDAEAEDAFAAVQALVNAVRSIRAEYNVPQQRQVRAIINASDAARKQAFASERGTIERLARISQLAFDADAHEAGAHAVLVDGTSVFVPLGDAIDVERECKRHQASLKRLEKQLTGLDAKLENPAFIAKAPTDVVQREREKRTACREQCDVIRSKLASLGCS